LSDEITTISVKRSTKEELDILLESLAPLLAKIEKKSIRKVSYDDLIRFLLKHAKIPERWV